MQGHWNRGHFVKVQEMGTRLVAGFDWACDLTPLRLSTIAAEDVA